MQVVRNKELKCAYLCFLYIVCSTALLQVPIAASSAESNKSKGWTASLMGKLSRWAQDYGKSSSARTPKTIRQCLKSAPRYCLASARDARLRHRTSSAAVVKPVLPLQHYYSEETAQGVCFPRARVVFPNAYTEEYSESSKVVAHYNNLLFMLFLVNYRKLWHYQLYDRI